MFESCQLYIEVIWEKALSTYCDQYSLVEKPIRCAQLLYDYCSLRLGGDSKATARVLSAVQNDVYTTGVMM
jgi:hypothetical protein